MYMSRLSIWKVEQMMIVWFSIKIPLLILIQQKHGHHWVFFLNSWMIIVRYSTTITQSCYGSQLFSTLIKLKNSNDLVLGTNDMCEFLYISIIVRFRLRISFGHTICPLVHLVLVFANTTNKQTQRTEVRRNYNILKLHLTRENKTKYVHTPLTYHVSIHYWLRINCKRFKQQWWTMI